MWWEHHLHYQSEEEGKTPLSLFPNMCQWCCRGWDWLRFWVHSPSVFSRPPGSEERQQTPGVIWLLNTRNRQRHNALNKWDWNQSCRCPVLHSSGFSQLILFNPKTCSLWTSSCTYTIWPNACAPLSITHTLKIPFQIYKKLHSSVKVFHQPFILLASIKRI